MRAFAALTVLIALTAPVLALEPDITPLPRTLPAEPALEFGPARQVTNWAASLSNGAYLVGTAKVAGMTGESVIAIAAQPGAKGRGEAGQSNLAIATWRGKRVRLSMRLKSEAAETLQLWLTFSGPVFGQQLRYEMPARDTTDWQTVEIVMDAPPDLARVAYGFFLEGAKGRAYADAVTMEVVGSEVPAVTLAGTRSDGWQWNQQLADRVAASRSAQQMQRMAQWRASRQAQERERFLTAPVPWSGANGYEGRAYGQ